MGMGKGRLFVTGECQPINVEGGWKKEKSPFGKHHSDD